MQVEQKTTDTISLTGCRWQMREAAERDVMALMQQHDLPELLARVLVARGIGGDAVQDFLNPSLKVSLPDPMHLLDMQAAAERVAAAVMGGERIAIFGDYDVDGATSSALLMRYLRALGSDPLVYIPDRMKEGYGPNTPALLALKQQGAAVVITVDCGTLSFEPLAAAHDAGLDVIVIDHHQGEAAKPKCLALVNPNRLDETSPHRQLAAVGVAFLLCVAVNRTLRDAGYFANSSPNRGEAGRGADVAHRYPLAPILSYAKDLRKNLTDAEMLLWNILRQEQFGVKFRKQHPLGNYIADFACLSNKLIIELDGGQHNQEENIKRDARRTAFFEKQGFSVLRFWNNDVLQNIEGVTESIFQAIHSTRPLPDPPPTGEGIPEPDLRQWLDIVALGTVCDVVPLTGVNRAFVAQGLKVMAARQNTGMRTVMDLAGLDEKPSVYTCGFVIGPRINAGGRVGKSDLGVRLLATDDEEEALALARELEKHNAERKAIEAGVLEQAMQMAELQPADAPLFMLSGKGWHPGVIGIVAGRVKDRFNVPTAIVGFENGIGKASARSVPGVDFGAAVIAAMEAGLLMAGGGHAMAAGFTVAEEKFAGLNAFLQQRIGQQLEGKPRTRSLKIDAVAALPGITPELVEMLSRIGPFGQANPNIRVMVERVVNLKPGIVGESHVKTLFVDPLSNARLSGISFRSVGAKLGEALLATRGKTLSVVGQLSMKEYNGAPSISFMIEDIAAC